MWLPEGSAKVEGEKKSNGSAIRKPGRWNDLRYVEGIFRESSDGDKIKVDGLEVARFILDIPTGSHKASKITDKRAPLQECCSL